ncbi:hypothetical protein [Sinomicrobium weinanense]|uniref:TerB family tellurite resistance protein n=1 Tax=Sinomicrobium weinanense TaxID=2842200 RepID=A0A926JUT3_9FLAO|nr:hypothetical protein [Sinomicrobium weinanense]MBC9797586.1 hypothetical protein [Sinomicrobium weinanense]MBU3123653.1 hypothetical protein [Sinomicrobium weinanense]
MKRTKTLWVFLLVGFFAINTARAQTFSEWWRQKKAQKKYLLQQIAALQVYIGYARKGYSIAKDGLNFIGDLKNGEMNLHADYFRSLGKVNPHIREYAKIGDIIALEYRMAGDYSQILKQLRQSDAFNKDELDYFVRVFGKTLDFFSDTLDELIAVSTDGHLEMTDDARLERIDLLYKRMTEHYTFFRVFRMECTLLAMARLREEEDTRTSRLLYNLKQ